MKNTIKYYYNMNPPEIHQINKKYKFEIKGKKYIFYPYTRKLEELNELYKLQIYLKQYGIYCHEILSNKNNEIITYMNETPYILINLKIEDRKISIYDISMISNIRINPYEFENIKRKNWYELWKNKIDYIEYQITQFKKKYKIIKESIDYYIGIVENCITMLSTYNFENQIYTISHDRISKETTTEEFYNPLNFIIDNRVRDISEYLKSYVISEDIIENIKEYIHYNKLNINDTKLLFIRFMYPSIYFDTYEQIIEKKMQENIIKRIINQNEINEKNIKKLYNYLRSISELPEIEWLL